MKLRVQTGLRLREAEGSITTEKVQAKERLPVLLHYNDNSTESKDEVATSGGGASITGNLLKFDEADDKQGIFFINTKDNSENKVPGKLLRNKPGELIFMTPRLPAGTCRVEVRVLFGNTKGLRKGALADVVTVS